MTITLADLLTVVSIGLVQLLAVMSGPEFPDHGTDGGCPVAGGRREGRLGSGRLRLCSA